MRRISCDSWPLCSILILSLSGVGSAQTPQTINIVAVTQSADFSTGLSQPGSLSSIFVTGLQGSQGIIVAMKYPLPNELAGISVWIDSLPAPILAVAFFDGYQQINLQVPWEARFPPKVVKVAQNGIDAQTSDVLGVLGWSVFFADANGYGIVQHALDYSLVTPLIPAHPGEYLITYAGNLGPVSNQPATGSPAPFNPLAESIPVGFPGCIGDVANLVQIGQDVYVAPTYIGLTPGSVGLYQVNFQLPSSVSAGDLPMSFLHHISGPPAVCYMTSFSRSVLLPVR